MRIPQARRQAIWRIPVTTRTGSSGEKRTPAIASPASRKLPKRTSQVCGAPGRRRSATTAKKRPRRSFTAIACTFRPRTTKCCRWILLPASYAGRRRTTRRMNYSTRSTAASASQTGVCTSRPKTAGSSHSMRKPVSEHSTFRRVKTRRTPGIRPRRISTRTRSSSVRRAAISAAWGASALSTRVTASTCGTSIPYRNQANRITKPGPERRGSTVAPPYGQASRSTRRPTHYT